MRADKSLEKDEDCIHHKTHWMREEPLAPLAWCYASVHPHCAHTNHLKGGTGLPTPLPPSSGSNGGPQHLQLLQQRQGPATYPCLVKPAGVWGGGGPATLSPVLAVREKVAPPPHRTFLPPAVRGTLGGRAQSS